MKLMRWGLIPSWATDESIGDKLINARAETISEKTSFKKGNYILDSARKLVSLWEMIEFFARGFIEACDHLDTNKKLMSEILYSPGISKEMVEQGTNILILCVDNVKEHAEELKLVEAKGRCERFKRSLEMSIAPIQGLGTTWKEMPKGEMVSEIDGILEAVAKELKQRKFAFIPPGKDDFFEKEELFGHVVAEKFPSAEHHVKAAGNCMAADLNTAAVYHLMCVVNVGLLALAYHLKLKIKAIEYQEWTNIIDGLKTKVNTLKQRTKSKKKQDDLEFYNGLLLEFSAFKDVYRNNMAHARARYRFHEAKGIYDRVHDFMKRLATRVSESR
jgi:hypothetical protein